MATSFFNAKAESVGTSEVTVYTVPEGQKAILIGCNIANIINTIVPITLSIKNDTLETTTVVVKNKRINNGESEEIMRGNKIVMNSGDYLTISSEVDDSVDIIASLLIGVS